MHLKKSKKQRWNTQVNRVIKAYSEGYRNVCGKNSQQFRFRNLSVGHFSLSVSVQTSPFNVFLGPRSITRWRKEVQLTSSNEWFLLLKNKIGGIHHLKWMQSGACFKTSLELICLSQCFIYFFSLCQTSRRRIWPSDAASEEPLVQPWMKKLHCWTQKKLHPRLGLFVCLIF